MTYVDSEGAKRQAKKPSSKVNGIIFARMQRGVEEFAVRVCDVVLDTPFPLSREHTDGKGLGPSPTTFGSDSARRLLDEIEKCNLGKAPLLAAIRSKL